MGDYCWIFFGYAISNRISSSGWHLNEMLMLWYSSGKHLLGWSFLLSILLNNGIRNKSRRFCIHCAFIYFMIGQKRTMKLWRFSLWLSFFCSLCLSNVSNNKKHVLIMKWIIWWGSLTYCYSKHMCTSLMKIVPSSDVVLSHVKFLIAWHFFVSLY